MSVTALAHDAARSAPAVAATAYLNFISTYGAPIVTTLTIGWIVFQAILRWREHQKNMREKDNGSE